MIISFSGYNTLLIIKNSNCLRHCYCNILGTKHLNLFCFSVCGIYFDHRIYSAGEYVMNITILVNIMLICNITNV